MTSKLARLCIVFALLAMVLGAQVSTVHPVTDLIPSNVSYIATESDWIRVTGVGAPKDAGSQSKNWRDNSFIYQSQNWWAPAPVLTPKTYRVLDTKLCGIDSPAFYATYELAQVKAYEERSFLFPDGVPCLVGLTLDPATAQKFNYGGSLPYAPFPVALRSDGILLPPSAPGGMVQWQRIEDFIRETQPHFTNPSDMVSAVKAILAGDKSDADKVKMMRVVLIQAPVPTPPI